MKIRTIKAAIAAVEKFGRDDRSYYYVSRSGVAYDLTDMCDRRRRLSDSAVRRLEARGFLRRGGVLEEDRG